MYKVEDQDVKYIKALFIGLYGKTAFFFALILLVIFSIQGCSKSDSVEGNPFQAT